MTDYFELTCILTALVALSIASYEDLKSREITSLTWMVAGSIGLAIFIVKYEANGIWSVAATSFLFYPAFFELSPTLRKILFAVGMAIFFAIFMYTPYYYAVEPPLVVLLGHILYYTKILKGGADAKAFMILGILFPTYPSTSIFAIKYEFFNLVFPFALMVIFYASLCLLFLIPYYAIKNLLAGRIKFPHMFFGYTIPIEKFGKKFVWLLEHVDESGKIFFKLSPLEDREKEDIERFRAMGKSEVWVQPQIPFVFFILLGYLLTLFIGNPILAVIS